MCANSSITHLSNLSMAAKMTLPMKSDSYPGCQMVLKYRVNLLDEFPGKAGIITSKPPNFLVNVSEDYI